MFEQEGKANALDKLLLVCVHVLSLTAAALYRSVGLPAF